jgi:ABC-type nitrate/sulfonate/bicarbonate transport system permease component
MTMKSERAYSVPVSLDDTAPPMVRAWRASSDILLPVVTFAVLLVVWQELVDSGVLNRAYVASPTAAIAEAVRLFGQAGFWTDLRVSGEELGLGLGIAIVIGISGGMLCGWYPTLRKAVQPIINGYSAVPQIALIPVIILLLGIGIASKVAMVALICVPTFWLNTVTGIQHIDQRYVRTARSFAATDPQMFRWVALPAAFPNMLSALRLGTGHALIAIIVAEIYGSQAGIGHRMTQAANNYDPAQMFACLLVITAFALLVNFGLSKLEKRFTRWEM